MESYQLVRDFWGRDEGKSKGTLDRSVIFQRFSRKMCSCAFVQFDVDKKWVNVII